MHFSGLGKISSLFLYAKHNVMLTILYIVLSLLYILKRRWQVDVLKNRLKELRARHNLTQIELAKIVGVTRQTIGFIEKGEFSPSVTLALKLADALDCNINELFWLEGEESDEK